MPYKPLAAEAGRIHVCAHRGHSVGAPENTLPALIAAAERGATVCEIDVVLTRDDEIVLLYQASGPSDSPRLPPYTLHEPAAGRARGIEQVV